MKIAVLSENYSPKEKALFLSDLENVKAEIGIRLWQRYSQLQFIPIPFSKKNNFHCTESSMFDGSTCDEQAVTKALQGITYDFRAILSKNLQGGGGGATSIWGAAFHNQLNSGQLGAHEGFHTFFGLAHDGGFMNESGNHGAAGESATFTVKQFEKINAVLNRFATIASPNPTIQITGAQVLTTSVRVNAKATGLIEHVDFTVDGIKTTYMYWERNQNFNQNGITAFTNPLPSGTHKIELTVYDVNNLSATAVTSVTI